jgi:hypothetical protein
VGHIQTGGIVTSDNHYFQLRKNAVGDATEEWYNDQPVEVKEWADEVTDELQAVVAEKADRKVMFGEKGARELLGALIVHCCGLERGT